MKRMQPWMALVAMCGLASGVAWGQTTTGNVRWTGGGATVLWDVPENWMEISSSLNKAPANPTAGTVYYTTADGTGVTGLLDGDRTVGGLGLGTTYEAGSGAHNLNLAGHILTVAGTFGCAMGTRSLAVTNGTLRIGNDSAEGDLMVGQTEYGTVTLTIRRATTFDSYRIGNMRVGTFSGSNAQAGIFDLRGSTVANGVLNCRNLYIGGRNPSYIALNNNTELNAIVVSNTFNMGESGYGGTAYIGNPSDEKLPPNIHLQVGVPSSARGSMQIGRNTSTAQSLNAKFVTSNGGSFTAYLTDLKIVPYEAGYSGNAQQNGLLDLSGMTNCTVDAVNILIAPNYSANASAQPRGTLRLPRGSVTAGTVVVGASLGTGFGALQASNTQFTVNTAMTLNATGAMTIKVDENPVGLDINGTFTDAGGTIAVQFLSEPAIALGTNWAIRVAGDARSTLNGMVGAGRLTATIGAFTGWKARVAYDGTYTYYALVDEAVMFPPVAVAQDVTFEIETGGTVWVDISEVDGGSNDPEGRTPEVITMSRDGLGGPFASSLAFDAVNAYPVVVKIEVGDPVESATDEGTVSVVAVHPGATGNRTWTGGGSTVLMDRREWMWSGNWQEGTPPVNPTTSRILYKAQGQSVRGLIEAPRTIGGIGMGEGGWDSINHTLDLGNTLLTLAGDLTYVGVSTPTLALTNGTLRIGSDAVEGNLLVGETSYGGAVLLCRAGTIIDTHRVGTLRAGTASGASNSQYGRLDLRRANIASGVLRAKNIITGARGTCYIALDGTTTISGIVVSNSLSLGESGYGGTAYIGNPADADRRLPANVNIQVGASPSARGSIQIGKNTSAGQSLTATLVASDGGAFTAWLTDLKIVPYEAGYSGNAQQIGMLDMSGMTNCAVDAVNILIAPNYSANASAQPRGTLKLPPGTVTAGSVKVGGPLGAGFGLLAMSNTVFTVTNALTIDKTAQIEIHVGDTSSGIDLTNADLGALDLDPDAAITVRFHTPPSHGGLHYGLRLAGDRVAMLDNMGANLLIDGSGLSKPVTVFLHQGDTYVGVPPLAGSLFLMR